MTTYRGIADEAGPDPAAQGREAARMVASIAEDVRAHAIATAGLLEEIDRLEGQLAGLRSELERANSRLASRTAWRQWQLREWWRQTRPAGKAKSLPVGLGTLAARAVPGGVEIHDDAALLALRPDLGRAPSLDRTAARKALAERDGLIILADTGEVVPEDAATWREGRETLRLTVGGVTFDMTGLTEPEDEETDDDE